MSEKFEIAVYYFPQYHPDPRNDEWHGKGWTEWEMLRRATPRFPGHAQPKVSVLGEYDESLPETAEKQIALAADHGVDTFIYDWYWYDGKPFLNGALDRAYLRARNNDRLKFALMWANHDWWDLYPAPGGSFGNLTSGRTSRESFEAATDYIITNYLAHPSYWKVEGKLYFSIFDFYGLVEGLGGIEQTKAALQSFRDKTLKAGLPGLHLNAIHGSVMIFCRYKDIPDADVLLHALGFDSVTSYNWHQDTPMPNFPATDYADYAEVAMRDWEKIRKQWTLPYYPSVSMGWDPTPRTDQSLNYEPLGYPYTAVLVDNTPEQFEKVLRRTKDDLREKGQSIFMINAWNEWTEGSYLEPDTVHGMGYLEAVRRVFGSS
ncbi:glycosyltransferase WbsX family protein [Cohnella silvisoli]|uniref:Glycoside hydrolase family 99-like domain-containing protein n=1 Tax=Cohnella silvisoli TaxID=2873699 RepID=A0ABV1KXH4_9BACL|nr:glycoside hydrolase family 99-like domain-containing protein [Cohnella silvisoli]MCD9024104.1 glycoside hydrolase family 99-like domain-containing protein [Cohnella silvisoli]